MYRTHWECTRRLRQAVVPTWSGWLSDPRNSEFRIWKCSPIHKNCDEVHTAAFLIDHVRHAMLQPLHLHCASVTFKRKDRLIRVRRYANVPANTD